MNDVLACECNPIGSTDTNCDATTGQCPCRENISGTKCDEAEPGYFHFPNPEGIILSRNTN